MRVEDGQVILERKDCSCHDGTQPKKKWKVCTRCKGTGRRGSGQCRECNPRAYSSFSDKRPGYVAWWDHDDPEPCSRCGGNFQDYEAEGWTDNLPRTLVAELPITVVGTGNRRMGWAEQYLGAGIYTVVDYGAHKSLNHEELIAKVRTDLTKSSTQACKMVKSKDDMTFADSLVIVLGDQGYSILPEWEGGDDETE